MEVRIDHAGGELVKIVDRVVPQAFELHIDRDNGRPIITLRFEVLDGVPQCRRAELLSTPGGREVLSSDLRGIGLEDLLEATVAAVALVSMTHGLPGWEDQPLPDPQKRPDLFSMAVRRARGEDDRKRTLATTRAVRRQARRKVTDELLKDVARVYRENLGTNPTTAVANYTGRAHRTAALYVKQARERGFLGAATVGKAGEQS